MLQLLLAALLATTAPGPAPPDTAIALTGDPSKDAPAVCLKMVGEKVDNALDGKPAVSTALTTYSVIYKLTDEQKLKLARDCAFFEVGFLIGVNAERSGLLNKVTPAPEQKGLTTGF